LARLVVVAGLSFAVETVAKEVGVEVIPRKVVESVSVDVTTKVETL
jgi:hypothetical protein